MEQGKGPEHRASVRFAMDFKISVYIEQDGSQRFVEDSVLQDVSMDGIGFMSHLPKLYHMGQRLHVSIVLPGTDTLEARLEGDATVVRLDLLSEATASVGLLMDNPLDFVSGIHHVPREPGQGE